MNPDLEIIDYDIEGAAYKDGHVVDGAYLIATVRRRAVVSDEPNSADRRVLQPAGDPTKLKVPVESLSAKDKAALFAAFESLESIVAHCAENYFVAAASDAKALDARIAAADRARDEHAAHERKIAEARAELAALDEAIAKKRVEAAP